MRKKSFAVFAGALTVALVVLAASGATAQDAVFVAPTGNVGIGTSSPSDTLHVAGSDGDTTVFVKESSGTSNTRSLVKLENNGPTRIRFTNTSNSEGWNIGHQSPSGTGFVISDFGDGTSEMLLDTSGNVTFAGTVTPSSSRTIKEQFSPVDSRSMLRRVLELPILSWSYKASPGVRHVGPMSEDFFAAFKVGTDDKGISVTDSAGVVLAALQGLHQGFQDELAARDAEIAALRARIEELAARLEQHQGIP